MTVGSVTADRDGAAFVSVDVVVAGPRVEGRVRRPHAHDGHLAAGMAPDRYQHRELHVLLQEHGKTISASRDDGTDRVLDAMQPGNETGLSDPVFMQKYGEELKKDSGKWIDHSVWHGKAHTWDKIRWLIAEVRAVLATSAT